MDATMHITVDVDPEDRLARLNVVYDKYKDDFEGSFHNMLWQVMVNGVRDETRSAFVVADAENMVRNGKPVAAWEFGIADAGRKGYTPGSCWYVGDYDKASRVAEELNKEVFGLEPEEGWMIAASTMRKG